MTRHDPHEAYDELVVGQALGALEPEDELALASHVLVCGRCRSSLDGHEATLAQLALAADPAEPPPALLLGIQRAIASSRVDLADGPRAPRPAAAAAGSAPARSGAGRAGDGRSMPRPRRWQRAPALLAAAAGLVLVVGLGAWNVSLQREADEQGQRGDRLALAVETLRTGPGTTVPLEAVDGPGVPAVAVLREDELTIVVDGLAPNDIATSTYVVWLAAGDGVSPLGTFDVPDTGVGVTHGLRLPSGVEPGSQLMVTREQGRTAPEMTRQPILAAGRLSA